MPTQPSRQQISPGAGGCSGSAMRVTTGCARLVRPVSMQPTRGSWTKAHALGSATTNLDPP